MRLITYHRCSKTLALEEKKTTRNNELKEKATPDMTGLRQGLELLVITRMVVGVQIQELVFGLGAPLSTNSLVLARFLSY